MAGEAVATLGQHAGTAVLGPPGHHVVSGGYRPSQARPPEPGQPGQPLTGERAPEGSG